jgi:hypothetical protein
MHAWLGTAKMLGVSLFSVVGIVSAVLAIWTMLPEEASKPCFLGYEAHCSFAPVSTIILFVVAAVLVLLGLRMLKK